MQTQLTEDEKKAGRIKIAQDVLERILPHPNWRAERGAYLGDDRGYYSNSEGKWIDAPFWQALYEWNDKTRGLPSYDGKCVLEAAEKNQCQFCALGAMMLARLDVFGLTVERNIGVGPDHRQPSELGLGDAIIDYGLADYFDKRQLGLIEAAFEGKASFAKNIPGVDNEEAEEAAWFGCDSFGKALFETENDLLRAIMENIIANGGTFIP